MFALHEFRVRDLSDALIHNFGLSLLTEVLVLNPPQMAFGT